MLFFLKSSETGQDKISAISSLLYEFLKFSQFARWFRQSLALLEVKYSGLTCVVAKPPTFWLQQIHTTLAFDLLLSFFTKMKNFRKL